MWSLTRGRSLKGGGLSPGVVVSYQWVVAHQEMVSHQGVDTHGEVVSHQEVVAQQEVLAQCLSSMSAEVACTAVSNTSHGFTPQLTKMSSPCLPVNDGGREWGREGGGVEGGGDGRGSGWRGMGRGPPYSACHAPRETPL